MMGYYYGYGPMNFFGGFLSILWWIFVIWAIIHVVRWLRHEGGMGKMGKMRGFRYSDSALDLLRERYVKGEIDKKEFEEKKKDLE
jgi:putative membrane protein